MIKKFYSQTKVEETRLITVLVCNACTFIYKLPNLILNDSTFIVKPMKTHINAKFCLFFLKINISIKYIYNGPHMHTHSVEMNVFSNGGPSHLELRLFTTKWYLLSKTSNE